MRPGRQATTPSTTLNKSPPASEHAAAPVPVPTRGANHTPSPCHRPRHASPVLPREVAQIWVRAPPRGAVLP